MRRYKIIFLSLNILIAQVLFADADIAVLLKSTSHPFWQVIYQSVEETAEENNIKILLRATSQINDLEGQLNICETLLLQKPKALIVAAINPYNLSTCLKKFHSQGISIIDIDGNLTEKIAKELGIKVIFSVASDNYTIGKTVATYLDSAEGKILILEGLPGSFPSSKRVEGFTENLPAGLSVVASLPANWDRMKAASITRDILLRHPDLKYIFSVSDGMGVGAAEALVELDRTDVKVVSVDGQSPAIQAIKAERMQATIAQLPYLMGQKALLETQAYLKNTQQEVNFSKYVPILTIDKKVLDQNKDPLLVYLK